LDDYFYHREETIPFPAGRNRQKKSSHSSYKPFFSFVDMLFPENQGPPMTIPRSPGAKLRNALAIEKPLQVVGTINAYHARMAERTGYKAIYLSGGGVAAGSLGLPDLGITTLDDVLTDVRRITDVCDLPLLVDIDTGFGGAFNIARTIRSLIKFGAAGCHIEDQVSAKRCGHRPGKAIVSKNEMVDRIKSALDARSDDQFVIMARTDALAVEGLESAIDRASACVAAGADMIFPEAVTDLSMYRKFVEAVKVPVLANITEFGLTPLFTIKELDAAGVSLVLYPLSAFRAMNKAALAVYQAVRRDGSQKLVMDLMQTRAELYDFLDYDSFEKKLDELFSKGEQQ
jgi:methylisocitrate lyase